MIRSFRVGLAIEWNLSSRKRRRWISSISTTTTTTTTTTSSWTTAPTTTHVSPPSSSARTPGLSPVLRGVVTPSHYSIAKNQYFARKPNGFSFFSTDSKSNAKSNSKSNPNENQGERSDDKDDDEKNTTQPPNQPTIGDQLKSIPNIITISRLASTPLLCYWIMNNEPYLAIGGCFLAGVSDVLDGYIAKNHNQTTVLGTYLDPFADKFFINSLALSLWHSGILPAPLVGLWAAKDVMLLGGMGWYLYKEQHTINFFSNSIHTKPLTVTPSAMGKANTGLQFATLAVAILTPVVTTVTATTDVVFVLPPSLLEGLCWVTGASSVITTLSYAGGGTGFKQVSQITGTETEEKSPGADSNSNSGSDVGNRTDKGNTNA